MTYTQAVNKACQLARKNGKIYFVVDSNEGNDYQDWVVATELDLDTFFVGINEFYVPFCTAEVEL